MKIYNIPIIVTQDEDDVYIGTAVGLPGCHTQAKDLETLYERMKEAIELYLEVKSEKINQEKFIKVHQLEVSV